MSPGFPIRYESNEKCSWWIEVDANSYIRLTFQHFDIFEEASASCTKDHVALYNVKTGADGNDVQNLVGLYCNTNKPRDPIYSNWNKMVVEFNTDFSQTRSGFMAKYTSIQYQIEDSNALDTNDSFTEGTLFFKNNQARCRIKM